ncbi:hypothetical protein XENORESO_004860 [Xenotaenia resolanae]|uniref:Uncharacterized protein n=1 Tax=Xenotaenia resolanae TaxID=208358 RepID=A0ABV0VLL9_9TELE
MTEREKKHKHRQLCKMCHSLVFPGKQSEDKEEEKGSGTCSVLSTAFCFMPFGKSSVGQKQAQQKMMHGRKQPLKCWTGEATMPKTDKDMMFEEQGDNLNCRCYWRRDTGYCATTKKMVQKLPS